jgi:hypothetical protein
MPEALNVTTGGVKWVPFARYLLRKLKTVLALHGIVSGRKISVAPDGTGTIEVRTIRLTARDDWPAYGIGNAWLDWRDYIRIVVQAGGFIVAPYIRRIGTASPITFPTGYKLAQVDYETGEVAAFPGYSAMAETVRHFPGSEDTSVTAVATTTAGNEVFLRNGSAAAIGYTGSATIYGGFKHTYTDPDTDETHTRDLLAVGTGGPYFKLIDASTGADLSLGGDLTFGVIYGGYPEVGPPRYTVSADGRSLFVEFGMNQKYGGASSALPKAFSVAIDFAADTQAVATEILNDAVFGTTTTHTTGSYTNAPTGVVILPVGIVPTMTASREDVITTTTVATYPMTRAMDAAGTLVTTTAEYEVFRQVTNVGHSSSTSDSSGVGGFSLAEELRISLPDGNAKTFDVTTISASSSVIVAVDTSETRTYEDKQVNQIVRIVYSDPAVPVLVYETTTTPATFSPGSPTWAYGDTVRVVGILIDGSDTVLLTESGAAGGSAVSHSAATVPSVTLWTSASSDGVETVYTFPSAAASWDTSYAVDVTAASLGYIKPLRRVHTENPSFVSGHGSSKFVVDIKSPTEWLVGVFRPTALDGSTINQFDVYSGGPNGGAVKQNLLAFMAEALGGDSPVDAVAAADLESGNLAGYDIRLSTGDIRVSSPLADASYTGFHGAFI